ncbi:MAG: DNA mismatch repair protein MutS [Bacillota bacterium]
MSRLTPMMEQYKEIKAQYADAILFFRVGDFYEMFFEDALTASRELDITLTSRDGNKEEGGTPLAGVPWHSASTYLSKLLNKGYKVAICDQVEDPAQAKGLVRREVTRVITPGTRIDDHMLQQDRNNYLAFLVMLEDQSMGLTCVDISTGELHAFHFEPNREKQDVVDEIYRFQPAELLLNPRAYADKKLQKTLHTLGLFHFSEMAVPAGMREALALLEEQFDSKSLQDWGITSYPSASVSTAAVLQYLHKVQKVPLKHIFSINLHVFDDELLLDAVTLFNLEVTETMRTRDKKHSLLGMLDRTNTAMGSRLLRKWLERPLREAEKIEQRWEAVDELKKNQVAREELAVLLADVYDLERLCSRINLGAVNPRDFLALKRSLQLLPKIMEQLEKMESGLLKSLHEEIPCFEMLVEELENAIAEDAPFTLKEGGIFKQGYSSEVDELRRLTRNSKTWMLELEKKERERTGIKSLKIRYNKVFGYYIEVTRANLEMVPPDYIRKQTLVNAERFYTEELKEKESIIINAEEKLIRLEYSLFEDLRIRLTNHTLHLQLCASILARLDCLISLAAIAAMRGYCRPRLCSQPGIHIKEGRHPVVERTMSTPFVPNDLHLDNRGKRIIIITGPNMGGKSTYCRSAALLVLMAQAGSFVPAAEMEFMPVEQIFARVGASDDLSGGRSTFMVEMEETASIINNASSRSLIILDEIGRGTSTYDGISLARAVLEYLHDSSGSMVLFSTHFHELTSMEDEFPAISNLSVSVRETEEGVIFLHRVVPGRADRSYGINVARLAQLPVSVIARAQQILEQLEGTRHAGIKSPGEKKKGGTSTISKEEETGKNETRDTISENPVELCLAHDDGQLSFFSQAGKAKRELPGYEKKIIAEIKELNLVKTTPLQALNKLFSFQSRLKENANLEKKGKIIIDDN